MMKIFDCALQDPQTGERPKPTQDLTLGDPTHADFEWQVSRPVLCWLHEEHWPEAEGIEVVAAVLAATTHKSGFYYYGDDLVHAQMHAHGAIVQKLVTEVLKK